MPLIVLKGFTQNDLKLWKKDSDEEQKNVYRVRIEPATLMECFEKSHEKLGPD